MWVMMMRPSKALSVARDETRERLHSKDDDDVDSALSHQQGRGQRGPILQIGFGVNLATLFHCFWGTQKVETSSVWCLTSRVCT